jgi:alpha-ketoglutarate-dependent taurine dioxygenase
LEVAALGQSLDEIVRRHEALRTIFTTLDAEPVQVVRPFTMLPLALVNLSGISEATRETQARCLAMDEAGRPFDLASGPLVRGLLLRLHEEEHVLLLTIHHIVADAYSLGVLTSELTALYKAFSAGEVSPLSALLIQYSDFAAWQREWLQGEALEPQVSYWKNQLAGSPPLLEIPTDRPRSQAQSFDGAAIPFELPAALTESLRSLSRRERCTLFMTLLAAFNVLLHRYSGQEDIVVGADIANRNRRELKGLIGFFVNMLVVRTDLSGNLTFLELLDRVRKVTSESYAHQDLPFDKLVERLQPERQPGYSPFFQVVFNYYLAFTDGLDLPGLTITDLNLDHEISRFDLSLFISDGAEKVSGCWRYSTALFDAATVEQMHGRFEALLHRIAEQPEIRLNSLDILTEAEKLERSETQKQLKKSNFDKFKKTRPKAIDQSQMKLVRVERLPGAEQLPLVIQPDMEDVDLAVWARGNLRYIEAQLLKHGAILFRNFRVEATEGFEQFARSFDPQLLDYTEPSSPRSEVAKKIYTSTEYPASQWIQMHNEMSYSRQWPHLLFFFCARPAEEGGATPLAFSSKVFDLLDPKIRELFIEKKVMYIRNFGDGLDLSWQHVFNTSDRSEVERYCRQASIEFEWQGGDRLRTRQVHQSVLRHPQTRDMVWFNQAHAFHAASLDPSVREALLAEKTEEEFPRNACYGDGTRIDDSVIEEIRQAYKTAAVTFDWQSGDILMIENMLVAHGRAPFTGARRILVAMSGAINGNDVEATGKYD